MERFPCLRIFMQPRLQYKRVFMNWIGLDWNALFRVDKIVKKYQINECIIQVLAHINRYV